ncbi:MAG: hypothetical protein MHM6MM_005177 [Cercozoa sp. M6MM]
MAQERKGRLARRKAAEQSAEQQRLAKEERRLESKRAAAVALLKKAQADFGSDLLDELLNPIFHGSRHADFGTSKRERIIEARYKLLHQHLLTDGSTARARQVSSFLT